MPFTNSSSSETPEEQAMYKAACFEKSRFHLPHRPLLLLIDRLGGLVVVGGVLVEGEVVEQVEPLMHLVAVISNSVKKCQFVSASHSCKTTSSLLV